MHLVIVHDEDAPAAHAVCCRELIVTRVRILKVGVWTSKFDS